jgi:hypothetical protein
MLNVIMLNVVILSVLAPRIGLPLIKYSMKEKKQQQLLKNHQLILDQ